MANPGPEFGYYVPRYDEYEDPAAWRRLVVAAEAAGFDSVWRDDHLVMPADARPADDRHGMPGWLDPETAWCEVFGTLSYFAALTEDMTLGTNVCVAPLRHPVHLAKQVFTLDALSEGRFDLGVGVGWLREEFERLGVPFGERGSRADEFLDLLARAGEEGVVAFDGPFCSFPETGFHPVPESDGPSIWVGGTSGAAFRRAAEYGDGWTITGVTPDEVADARGRLERAWRDAGREDPRIQVRHRYYLGEREVDSSRPVTVGSADALVESVGSYVEAGATHLVMRSVADEVADEVDQLERFGAEVIPSFR